MKVSWSIFNRNGKWYLKVMRGGQEVLRKSLRTDDRAVAEQRAEKLLLPYRLENEADSTVEVARRVTGINFELDKARKAIDADARVSIAEAWDVAATEQDAPDCSAEQTQTYRLFWSRFATFMRASYPAVSYLDEVVFRPHVVDFLASQADRSPNRYNKCISSCKLVFTLLAHVVPGENPFAHAKAKRLSPRGRRDLSMQEVEKILAVAHGEMRTMFLLGIYTGQRMSDVASLDWRQVNMITGIIEVTPSKTKRFNKKLCIPIHAKLRERLEQVGAKCSGPVMPELARLSACRLSQRIQSTIADAGIETAETGKNGRSVCLVGFHSLRHSFVTAMIEAGVSPAIVEEIVGHGSPAMRRIYSHISKEALAGEIAKMPTVGGGAAVDVRPLAWEDEPGHVMVRVGGAVHGMEQKDAESLADAIMNVMNQARTA